VDHFRESAELTDDDVILELRRLAPADRWLLLSDPPLRQILRQRPGRDVELTGEGNSWKAALGATLSWLRRRGGEAAREVILDVAQQLEEAAADALLEQAPAELVERLQSARRALDPFQRASEDSLVTGVYALAAWNAWRRVG
jgi:hypothetical protein